MTNSIITGEDLNTGFAVHLITVPPKSHGGYANRYYLPFGHSKWIGRGRHAFCIFKLLFIWINKGAHGAAKKKKVAKKRVDKKKQHLCLDSFLGFKIIFIFLQFMTRSGQTGRCTGLHASTKLCNDRGITVLDPKWKFLLKCTDCTILSTALFLDFVCLIKMGGLILKQICFFQMKGFCIAHPTVYCSATYMS